MSICLTNGKHVSPGMLLSVTSTLKMMISGRAHTTGVIAVAALYHQVHGISTCYDHGGEVVCRLLREASLLIPTGGLPRIHPEVAAIVDATVRCDEHGVFYLIDPVVVTTTAGKEDN